MNKKIIGLFLIMSIILCGCNSKYANETEEYLKYRKDISESYDFCKKYMEDFFKGDSEKLETYYNGETSENLKEPSSDEFDVISYMIAESINSKNKNDYIVFDVRNDKDKTLSQLETRMITIKKKDGKNEIVNTSSSIQREIKVVGNKMRLRRGNSANTDLLMENTAIPDYIQIGSNSSGVRKNKVSKDEFGVIAMSMVGQLVAVTTKGPNAFVGILTVDNAEKANTGESILSLSDKIGNGDHEIPISESLIGLDVIETNKIDNIFFSDRANYLFAEYINEYNNRRTNIYNVIDKRKFKIDLDEEFDPEKYNVSIMNYNNGEIELRVYSNIELSQEETKKIGIYLIEHGNKEKIKKVL